MHINKVRTCSCSFRMEALGDLAKPCELSAFMLVSLLMLSLFRFFLDHDVRCRLKAEIRRKRLPQRIQIGIRHMIPEIINEFGYPIANDQH